MAFEEIVVVNGVRDGHHEVDIGRLAESLLFYQRVRLLLGPGGLRELVHGVGGANLIELMSRGSLKVSYADNVIVVHTQTEGLIQYYDLGTVTSEKVAIEPRAHNVFCEFDSVHGTEHARRFLALAEDRPYEANACDDARSFLEHVPTVETCVDILLSKAGGLPKGHPALRFRPTRQDDGRFTVDSNLELDTAKNRVYLAGGPLTPARLIAFCATVRPAVTLAGECQADLETNDVDAALIEAQFSSILRRRWQTADKALRGLQEVTLGRGHAVAEAINSGQRTFDDLLVILDKAERFREWLRKQEPTPQIIHDFYRSSTETSWIEKLPQKTLRWLVSLGTGVLPGLGGAAAGTGLSVVDTFWLDNFARGWKPNQFVDGDLYAFANKPWLRIVP